MAFDEIGKKSESLKSYIEISNFLIFEYFRMGNKVKSNGSHITTITINRMGRNSENVHINIESSNFRTFEYFSNNATMTIDKIGRNRDNRQGNISTSNILRYEAEAIVSEYNEKVKLVKKNFKISNIPQEIFKYFTNFK